MKLSAEQKTRLLNFIGYGRLETPLWFLGMEEGIGGQAGLAQVEQNILTRAAHFQSVEDLATSHDHFDYDVRVQNKFTHVWLWMAKLTRALLHQASDWQDVQQAKDYIRTKLGRANGETLLTELLPLPALGLGHWIYEDWASREVYTREILPIRQQQLRQLINTYKPRYMLAYGSQYHPYYKHLLPTDTNWIKLADTKRIEIGYNGQTAFVLMPFFGQGALGTADAQRLIDYLASHP